MDTASLQAALRQFEASEANLRKLEALWQQIRGLIGEGFAFGAPPEYENACRAFRLILPSLPGIDGFRVEDRLLDFDDIGQMRFDALEVGEVESHVSVENEIDKQGKVLDDYRFRLLAKRRELVRSRMITLVEAIDTQVRRLATEINGDEPDQVMAGQFLSQIEDAVNEIDALIGSVTRPPRWKDLRRHLHFGALGDMFDIVKMDWPSVRTAIVADLYGDHDPVPVETPDLGALVMAHPQGPVSMKLKWSVLTDEDFERLMFVLISTTPGYENPAWLQHTKAADRGRDLSVTRIIDDPLEGIRRQRVIIQCKHWQTRSINITDVSALQRQMDLWQPPRVDTLIIATTGRFTADAVDYIEKHNQGDRALTINMWPDSHLERLLAARPHLIAQFKLRQAN